MDIIRPGSLDIERGIAEGDSAVTLPSHSEAEMANGHVTGEFSHATSMCACIVSPSEEVVCDLTLGLRGPSNTFADPHLGT